MSANTLFAGGTQGRLTWSPTARTLTIRLATGNGSQQGVAASIPVYTPDTALKDLAGNTMAATAFSAPTTSRF